MKRKSTNRRLLWGLWLSLFVSALLLWVFARPSMPEALSEEILSSISRSEVSVQYGRCAFPGGIPSQEDFLVERRAVLDRGERELLSEVFLRRRLLNFDWPLIKFCADPEYRFDCDGPDGRLVFWVSLRCNKILTDEGVHELPIGMASELRRVLEGARWQASTP